MFGSIDTGIVGTHRQYIAGCGGIFTFLHDRPYICAMAPVSIRPAALQQVVAIMRGEIC